MWENIYRCSTREICPSVRSWAGARGDEWNVEGSVVLSNMKKRNVLAVTAVVKRTTATRNVGLGRTRMRNVDRHKKSMRSGLHLSSRAVCSSLVTRNRTSLVVSVRPVRTLHCLPCLRRRN